MSRLRPPVSPPQPPVRAGLLSRLGGALRAALTAPSLGGDPAPVPHTAASVGRRLSGWRPTGTGPNAVVQASAPELVRRSRDLRRNNPYGKRAMDLLQVHLVGTGIKPRPTCANRDLRDSLLALWGAWVSVADADGVLDFYGMQQLVASEMVEAGEAFCRFRTRLPGDGLPVPLQLQLLPTEMVPLSYAMPGSGGTVAQGIERDAIGRRVAYWMYPRHPGEAYYGAVIDMTPRRIPAADVLHVYSLTRIGQQRGLPWLSAALTALHQLDGYVDAEILRKQLAASVVAFVKRQVSADLSDEERAAMWGKAEEIGGAATLEPGTVQYLDPDEDVVFSQAADVGGSFEPFLAAVLRSAAAASGVTYEEMTGDWSRTNDRTFRVQFNTFRRAMEQTQHTVLVVQFCNPVWRKFVDYALASGALTLPAGCTVEDAHRVAWLPQRWPYINPTQDIAAVTAEVRAGLTSRTAAVAERGDDVEEIDRQNAADQSRADDLNLVYDSDARQTSKAGLTQARSPGAVLPGTAQEGADGPPDT